MAMKRRKGLEVPEEVKEYLEKNGRIGLRELLTSQTNFNDWKNTGTNGKIICKCLDNKVIQRSRHGFVRNKLSSQYNFLYFFCFREMGLMKKGEAVKLITSIHLDLTKAFDLGSHSDILITTAEKYESGKIIIKRLLGWLRQCAQRTIVQSLLSYPEDASSETLQLSVLISFSQYFH